MNFRERINAVLHRENPDQVPWVTYPDLVPRGAFERELRNKGMGLLYEPSIFGSRVLGDVTYEIRIEGNITIVHIHTPVGTISQRLLTYTGKRLRTLDLVRRRPLDPFIKTEADYDAAIYLLDSIEYYADYQVCRRIEKELGEDGIIRAVAFSPPYEMTERFFGGECRPEWFAAQLKHPHEFDKLVRACERQVERMLPFVIDSLVEYLHMGSLSGNYGPKQWEKYCLPFFQKYTHLLHKKGKILNYHVHALNLKFFKHLLAKSGLDAFESFTTPPVGNLSIAEAREAWGDEAIIYVSIPETIFWYGAEYTKKYTIDLLKSDPPGNRLVIGPLEMHAMGIVDQKTEVVFKAGLRAITDAINEYGKYPIKGQSKIINVRR